MLLKEVIQFQSFLSKVQNVLYYSMNLVHSTTTPLNIVSFCCAPYSVCFPLFAFGSKWSCTVDFTVGENSWCFTTRRIIACTTLFFVKPHFYLLVNYIQYETQFLSNIKDMKKIKVVSVFLIYLNCLFHLVISEEVTCSNHEYNMALVHLKTCSIQGKCRTGLQIPYTLLTSNTKMCLLILFTQSSKESTSEVNQKVYLSSVIQIVFIFHIFCLTA